MTFCLPDYLVRVYVCLYVYPRSLIGPLHEYWPLIGQKCLLQYALDTCENIVFVFPRPLK